jgi:hypothetical protein
MRKRTAVISLALAFLMLLSSCSEVNPGPKNETEDTPDSVVQPDTASDTDTQEPDTDTDETEPAVVSIPEEDFFEDLGRVKVLKGLDFVPHGLTNSDNGCVVAYMEEGTSIRLAYIDFENRTLTQGTVDLGETVPGGLRFSAVCLANGFVVISTDDTQKLTVTDRELNVVYEGVFEDVTGEMVFAGNGRVMSGTVRSGRAWVATVGADGQVEVGYCDIRYPGGKDNVYISGHISGDEMLADFYSSETFGAQKGILDISTGECITFSEDLEGFMACGGCIVSVDYISGEIKVFNPETPHVVTILDTTDCDVRDSWYPAWPKGDSKYLSMIRSDEEDHSLAVIDPKTGAEVSRLSFGEEVTGIYPVIEVGERVCVLLQYGYEGAGADILIADLTGGEAAEGWPPLLTEESAVGKSANNRKAEEIYEKFGISVYLREDAVRYLNGYAVLPCSEETKISETLDALVGFFERCPEGFIRNIAEQYSAFDICLVGRIIPDTTNRNSIGDASAFTVETGGIELIVINALMSDKGKTVAHEFFHAIENTIFNMSVYDPSYYGLENFARWEQLNPPGFEYRYIYTEEDGRTVDSDAEYLSTAWYEGREDDIYFVDGYCTTYPSEDRARIFEYIATFPEGLLPQWFGRNMLLKAEYLSACIREVFADENWNDVYWEKMLDPAHDLQYFRDNYPLYWY